MTDHQVSLGWMQRCAKEDAAATTFWKSEEKKRAVRQASLCDGSSIATSTWVSNDSTIATMVLKDKLRKLEEEMKSEQNKMLELNHHFEAISGSTTRVGSPASRSRVGTPASRVGTPGSGFGAPASRAGSSASSRRGGTPASRLQN